MNLRPRTLSALLVSAAVAATATAAFGGLALTAQASPDTGASAHAAMDHAAVAPRAGGDDPDGDGYIPAVPQVTGVTPSWNNPPDRYFHEFQANCAVTKTASDDPIVFAGRPGASHNHTFMGNTATDAFSTTASLSAGRTACTAPGDLSGYWMPTLYNGDRPVLPTGPQVIYYKTGVTDYKSVRPFPKGLRFLVGSPHQTAAEFRGHPGWVEGWECGDSFKNTGFPAHCPAGTQLNIRMQSPSCWDGTYLDTPDHKAHMAYPVVKPGNNDNVCPASHPVAVPMVEFKMAFPVSGDMSRVRLSSGGGHSFHYDFFNAWDERTLNALVEHCIKGGLQCNARGYDETHPGAGAALGPDHRLP
ncbi:DUF1996 domain-containing protein [Streptomyces subrutilus]|uniref:DUF1996 domain-containing protein n=1 Tax=Streptomyces subrutilus TaxID=36818 RepID=A0A1E5PMA8_9ACTN|nr:DUF1996 domain-containing protein [Streptomyces subrutilus]OEJ30688.1 hypothetical protein BGK67_04415 [Streptomyces subrutilus]